MNSPTPGLSKQIPSPMTVRDYLKVLFRQKSVILFTVLCVSVVSWILLEMSTPVYESQVKMLISAEKQVDSPFFKDSSGNREMQALATQSEIVKSKPVLQSTIEALKLDQRPLDYEKQFASPLKRFWIDWVLKFQAGKKQAQKNSKSIAYRKALNCLGENIDVKPVRDSNIFTITARDFDPAFAAALANSISRSYVVFDLKQQMVDMRTKYTGKNLIVMQMNQNIAMMESGLDGQPLPNDEAIGPASVKIIEQSTPPLEPKGLPKKIVWVVSVLMSIPLAIVLAFTFQSMDQSFFSRQDVEHTLGLPVVACINKKKGFGKPRVTAYQTLAEQILFMVKSKEFHTFLFLSTHPKDGASPAVSNAAVFLSKEFGFRTLVIDSHIRNPRQNKIFSVSNDPGLAQALESGGKENTGVISIGERLDLLPAGVTAADPAGLLDAPRIKSLLEKLKSQHDVILIDGPDMSSYRDSRLIAPAVDAVFFVVGESLVRRQTVHFYLNSLREADCHVEGVILSNRHALIPKLIYESL